MGQSIPKIIHQTYFSARLPAELQLNVEKLKQQNPSWEYRFYDDEAVKAFIHENYGEAIWHAYERINPGYGAARADLFRYLLMYKSGGVYLDVKSSLSRPLHEILKPDDMFVLSGWRNLPGNLHEGYGLYRDLSFVEWGEFQQWHIMAAVGHPFLHAVIEKVLKNIDEYRPWRHNVGREGVLRVTGPIAYTLAIYPLLTQLPHRFVRFHDDLGLQYSIYGDQDQHVVLFKSHYAMRKDPVVSMKGALYYPSVFFCWLKGILKPVRRVIRAYIKSRLR